MIAIQIVGSQSALARAIHVRQQDVWYWLNRAKAIPAKHAKAIESATGGRVSCYQLCPDVFKSDPAAAPHTRRTTDRPEDRAA